MTYIELFFFVSYVCHVKEMVVLSLIPNCNVPVGKNQTMVSAKNALSCMQRIEIRLRTARIGLPVTI